MRTQVAVELLLSASDREHQPPPQDVAPALEARHAHPATQGASPAAKQALREDLIHSTVNESDERTPELAERDLLRQLFDAMPQLGWTAHADGFIDYYNRGWYEYTGTTYEQMKGWGWTAVHHSDELPRVMESWGRSIATGKPWEIEFPIRRRDGVYRWFLSRATPIYHDGELVRWVGINTDIDDQKRAEAKPEGGTISLAVERSGAEVLFRVKDNGLGIEPEMLPKVFDLFVQVDRSLDRSQGGLGIGLTLVRSIVGMHGGTVEARSAGRGQGTEFTVRLPALPEKRRGLTNELEDSRAAPPAPKRRILVVDDSVDSAETSATT